MRKCEENEGFERFENERIHYDRDKIIVMEDGK
jgi:hypothetical protein